MWTNRIVMLALLVGVGVAIWRVGGMLSADARGMAVGMVFGAIAGIPAALLVLVTARRAPAPDPYEAPGVRDWRSAERRRADERAALEKEYNGVGHWTVINGRTCYVVPQVGAFVGDGEEVGIGDGNEWQYWLGDYHSDRQFTVAGVITDGGGIARRSTAFGWGNYL